MLLRRNSGRESTPTYDSILEDSFVSMKIYHGGVMKRIPDKHYINGDIDYIDYINVETLNLQEFKKMTELCGYASDSITFWYKCGKSGKRWRLISTDFEAYAVSKNIRKEDVNEIYFEHLDSYFKMGNSDIPSQATIEDYNKERLTHENSSGDEFDDLEADLSDCELVNGHEKTKQSILGEIELLSAEINEKMAAVEGDTDCYDSTDTRSLHSDSETESYKYPQFNPKIDGDNPILALELTFGSKREFKDAVATHEIKRGKYIKWNKNDKEL